MESTRTASTRLLFCTTGVLLRRLQEDPDLGDVSHVIVDEAHERDVLSDFLLVLLRHLVDRRPELRVVIMSATIAAEEFADYFGGDVPIVRVAGRTYPVDELYLEDVLEATGHRVVEGHECALRKTEEGGGCSQRLTVSAGRGRSQTVMANWESEIQEETVENELYDDNLYTSYSETTRASLRRVDEGDGSDDERQSRINYDLIEDVLDLIARTDLDNTRPACEGKGAVLIFLPGLGEITQLYDRLMNNRRFSRSRDYLILALHSSLSNEHQRRIFAPAPRGARKIVLATNIAETSITIDDVVFVIDSGRVKQVNIEREHEPELTVMAGQTRYDERRRLRQLVETWVDQASARQRAGRAGRVRPGVSYRLYTRARLEAQAAQRMPEMRRVPLEELCLQVLEMRLGDPKIFLAGAMEPPSEAVVTAALQTLIDVQALLPSGELTPLGHHLARLPMDPHLGKMLIMAAIFGCLDPVLSIAACCSHKSPFAASVEQRSLINEAKRILGGASPVSDLLLQARAYEGWFQARTQGRGASASFCAKHCLSEATLEQLRDLRSHFAELLRAVGFLSQSSKSEEGASPEMNRNSDSSAVVCGIVLAGLYPNLAQAVSGGPGGGPLSLRGPTEQGLVLHPSSVIKDLPTGTLVAYHEKVETTRRFLRDATVVPPAAALMFGGSVQVDHKAGMVTLDGWLTMPVPARTAVMLKELRKQLDSLLQWKLSRPHADVAAESASLVKAVVMLLRSSSSSVAPV